MSVVVAGNLVLDLLAWPVDEVKWDGTVWVEHFVRSVGGNGANTSYTLARMGVKTTLLGAVGDDREGGELIEILDKVGVATHKIEALQMPTPTTMALVKRTGSRAFIHRPGASRAALTQPLRFANEKHFHLANPFAVPALRTLAPDNLRRAKEAGLTTSMDTGWDSRGQWGEVVLPCLKWVDILFVNEDEARRITGARTWRGALKALAAKTVVLKRGAKGAIVNGKAVAGYKVEAVDSTGAGDVFAGAWLAAWFKGFDEIKATEFANGAAAMSVQAIGSIAGVGTFKQTQAWIASSWRRA